MVATSGSDLIASDAALARELFLWPRPSPNRHEAGGPACTSSGRAGAERRRLPSPIALCCPAQGRPAVTLTPTICSPSRMARRSGFRVSVSPTPTPTVRCTLSSAIAANLPSGLRWKKLSPASAYLTDALNAQARFGPRLRPADHTLGGVGSKLDARRSGRSNKESVFFGGFSKRSVSWSLRARSPSRPTSTTRPEPPRHRPMLRN